jgi:uncharacterized protein CbrC (UPF0167 family)
MAQIGKCNGCDKEASYIVVAQFYNGPREHKIICIECWEDGFRCFYSQEDDWLTVSKTKPSEVYNEAKLYYDEGGFVTGGNIPIAYPDMNQ